MRRWAIVLLVVLCLQVTYGAFTSGLKAGYGFNTFPKMDEDWVPEALFTLTPYWKNFLEDRFSVQFVHRWLGTLLVLATLGYGRVAIRFGQLNAGQRRRLNWVLWLVSTQFCLGVATLLMVVPIALAVLHQLVALLLFAAFLALIHALPSGSITEVPSAPARDR